METGNSWRNWELLKFQTAQCHSGTDGVKWMKNYLWIGRILDGVDNVVQTLEHLQQLEKELFKIAAQFNFL
jgi:hypothetical protein